MKKKSIVFALFLLLLCAGCKNGETESGKEYEQEQTPKQEIDMSVTEYQRTFISWDGGTQMLNGGYQTTAGCNTGYFFLDSNNQACARENTMGYVLRYYDFETEETIALCSRTDCNHALDTCDAYRELGKYLWYQKGRLYYLCNGEDGRELRSCAADGTGEITVGKIDAGGKLCKEMLIHNGYFYATAYSAEEAADMAFQLVRMPLTKDAAFEILMDIPWAWDYAPDTMLTARGDSLWIVLMTSNDQNGLYEYKIENNEMKKIFQYEIDRRHEENTIIHEMAVDAEGTVYLVNSRNWEFWVSQWKDGVEKVLYTYPQGKLSMLMIRCDDRYLYLIKYWKDERIHEEFGSAYNSLEIEIVPLDGGESRIITIKPDVNKLQETLDTIGYKRWYGEGYNMLVYMVGSDDKYLMLQSFEIYMTDLEGTINDGYGAIKFIAEIDKIMSGEEYEWKVIDRVKGSK